MSDIFKHPSAITGENKNPHGRSLGGRCRKGYLESTKEACVSVNTA